MDKRTDWGQVALSAITAFIIGAGSAYGVLTVSLPTGVAVPIQGYIGCVIGGLIVAAKDVRTYRALPPVSDTK